MNKLQNLDNLIEQTIEEYDNEIVEISSIEQLYELSSMSGGSVQGHVDTKKLRRENKMVSRKDIITERKLRQYIRNKITSTINNRNKPQLSEEMKLRMIIRKLIKEGDISDVHPHRSTGINTLEDVLKKAIPTLRMDFKKLTTNKSQRDSFRAHVVKAVKDSIAPMQANDQYLSAAGDESSTLLQEPVGEPEETETDELSALASLEEADIEVDMSDDDKKIPVEDDDQPSAEEEFGTGLEGMDETGRNMAFTSYKKISQYILDAYDSLANPQDKKVFTEYLITNLKLYFDKFEDELQNTVQEPTTPEYDKTKA